MHQPEGDREHHEQHGDPEEEGDAERRGLRDHAARDECEARRPAEERPRRGVRPEREEREDEGRERAVRLGRIGVGDPGELPERERERDGPLLVARALVREPVGVLRRRLRRRPVEVRPRLRDPVVRVGAAIEARRLPAPACGGRDRREGEGADGENGRLTGVDDVMSFAEALGTLMSDANVRSQLGQQARKSVRRFSLETVVRAWDDVFASVTRSRRMAA